MIRTKCQSVSHRRRHQRKLYAYSLHWLEERRLLSTWTGNDHNNLFWSSGNWDGDLPSASENAEFTSSPANEISMGTPPNGATIDFLVISGTGTVVTLNLMADNFAHYVAVQDGTELTLTDEAQQANGIKTLTVTSSFGFQVQEAAILNMSWVAVQCDGPFTAGSNDYSQVNISQSAYLSIDGNTTFGSGSVGTAIVHITGSTVYSNNGALTLGNGTSIFVEGPALWSIAGSGQVGTLEIGSSTLLHVNNGGVVDVSNLTDGMLLQGWLTGNGTVVGNVAVADIATIYRGTDWDPTGILLVDGDLDMTSGGTLYGTIDTVNGVCSTLMVTGTAHLDSNLNYYHFNWNELTAQPTNPFSIGQAYALVIAGNHDGAGDQDGAFSNMHDLVSDLENILPVNNAFWSWGWTAADWGQNPGNDGYMLDTGGEYALVFRIVGDN